MSFSKLKALTCLRASRRPRPSGCGWGRPRPSSGCRTGGTLGWYLSTVPQDAEQDVPVKVAPLRYGTGHDGGARRREGALSQDNRASNKGSRRFHSHIPGMPTRVITN